ncbi:MAG: 50S ribosomal protein L15 [Spirochaetes bacterium RBG_13_51_14]|nr:MAG: 50S ribosomal protein L15 [Spirochaetes bacterium RBG_13_51_14]
MEGTYSLKKPDYIKGRKRVGRGNGSGHGSQCGKGHDGQLGRSGRKRRAWFEGGQMPLQRRVPKRGFNNFTKKNFQVVNLSLFDKLGAAEVDPELMKKEGAIVHADRLVKVLGNGEMTKPVTVTADAFSKTAVEKIKKAGGKAIVRKFPSEKKAND